jgi:hypothetical protein
MVVVSKLRTAVAQVSLTFAGGGGQVLCAHGALLRNYRLAARRCQLSREEIGKLLRDISILIIITM